MNKYYVFRPNPQGNEPLGTSHHALFKLKTDAGAIRRARRIFGKSVKVFRYLDLYDKDTFVKIHN